GLLQRWANPRDRRPLRGFLAVTLRPASHRPRARHHAGAALLPDRKIHGPRPPRTVTADAAIYPARCVIREPASTGAGCSGQSAAAPRGRHNHTGLRSAKKPSAHRLLPFVPFFSSGTLWPAAIRPSSRLGPAWGTANRSADGCPGKIGTLSPVLGFWVHL